MTIDKKKLAIQILAVIGLILSIKLACIYYVANYKVTPRKMNDGKYSLGNKYFDNDYITVNYDNNELKQILIEEYDYVYLYEIDEQFISKYKNLFAENVPINEQQLYKINKLSKNNNILSLVED